VLSENLTARDFATGRWLLFQFETVSARFEC